MIRRQDREGWRWKLPWFAAACMVLLGLTSNLHAGARSEPGGNAGLLCMCAAGSGCEIDPDQEAPGHGGDHCLAGPGCAPAAALPEAAILRIGKCSPRLVRSDLLAQERIIRPPVHPPKPADLA